MAKENIAGGESAPTRAHGGDLYADRFGGARYAWRKDEDLEKNHGRVLPWPMCSFCGSITPADMIALMQTEGTEYSGSDWKYGFPHKFYIEAVIEPIDHYCIGATYQGDSVSDFQYHTKAREHLKFYTVHMGDATDEQVSDWNVKVAPLLGVRISRDEAGVVRWHATPGHQASGVVSRRSEDAAVEL